MENLEKKMDELEEGDDLPSVVSVESVEKKVDDGSLAADDTIDLLDSDETASTVVLAEASTGTVEKNPSVVIIDRP